jgi:PKD repeat protein
MKKITLIKKTELMKYYLIISFLALSIIGKSQCDANLTYTIGDAGLVYFTNISNGTNDSTFYVWTFGDGTPENQYTENASHTYEFNHTYYATLSMYNLVSNLDSTLNCYDDTTFIVIITNAAEVICDANFEYTIGGQGNVEFTNTSTISGNSTNNSWYFGDGYNSYSDASQLSHTYLYDGTYTVYFSASNNLCNSNIEYTFEIDNALNIDTNTCNALFDFTLGAEGSVNFFSTSEGTSPSTFYYWSFGDGTSGNSESNAHTYLYDGTFQVSLNIFDSLNFCSSNVTNVITVSNAACYANADFNFYKDSLADFTWFAYPNYPYNVSSATWIWGDGSSSDALYPSHAYAAAGLYTICLVVTVDCGSTDTTCVLSDIFRLDGESNENDIINISVIDNSVSAIKDSEKEVSMFTVYPNPNNGEFSFEIKDESIKSKYIDINLSNVIGEVVHSAKQELVNGKVSINLNNLPKGTYFLNANTINKVYSSRVIVN